MNYALKIRRTLFGGCLLALVLTVADAFDLIAVSDRVNGYCTGWAVASLVVFLITPARGYDRKPVKRDSERNVKGA